MPDAALLPTTQTDSVRDRLRVAIDKRNSRREAVRMAETTAQRADTLLKEAETALAAFSNVDAACQAYRSAVVRRAVAGGGEVGALDLPEYLQKQSRDRDAARARRDDIGGTKAQLGAEVEMAKNTLSAAERTVALAARDILLEAAEDAAGKLYSARREFVAARDVLAALAAVWVASDFVDRRTVALPIPGWVRSELERASCAADEVTRRFSDTAPLRRAPTTEQFRAALSALAEDADAPLPQVER